MVMQLLVILVHLRMPSKLLLAKVNQVFLECKWMERVEHKQKHYERSEISNYIDKVWSRNT